MNVTRSKAAAACGLALTLAAASPAAGQASRTWVSGVGDDANPCSRTAPCKTFAGAISKTAAKGEINALDPGGFGAVTITKAISIVADGVEAGVLAAATNGITVNAGANDVVVLRGLDIEGFGTGLKGINFIAGGQLHVDRCTIKGFTQPGINFAPTGNSQLFVRGTMSRGNSRGILVRSTAGAARASIESTSVDGNDSTGIRVQDNADVTLRNVVASGNGQAGLSVGPSAGTANVAIEGSTLANNGTGILSGGGGGTAVVRVATTTITGNAIGLDIDPGGSILSFGNNRIADNAASDPPTGTIAEQ